MSFLAKGASAESQVALNCHQYLVSFNQQQLVSNSLTFTTLAFSEDYRLVLRMVLNLRFSDTFLQLDLGYGLWQEYHSSAAVLFSLHLPGAHNFYLFH